MCLASGRHLSKCFVLFIKVFSVSASLLKASSGCFLEIEGRYSCLWGTKRKASPGFVLFVDLQPQPLTASLSAVLSCAGC